MQVTLSGFVSVFFEKVLKSRVVNLSVWDRNFQVTLEAPHVGVSRPFKPQPCPQSPAPKSNPHANPAPSSDPPPQPAVSVLARVRGKK